MLSFKYCDLLPALFARADFLRSNFLWLFLATRILPVAVILARFFKYDFVFIFGIFYPFIRYDLNPNGNALPFQVYELLHKNNKNQVFIECLQLKYYTAFHG